MLPNLIQAVVLLALGSFAVSCFMFAAKLFRADGHEYERNRDRTGGFRKALRGEIETVFDGARDYRVSAGIAIDRNTNSWVEQGRLSEEAISASLRPARQ